MVQDLGVGDQNGSELGGGWGRGEEGPSSASVSPTKSWGWWVFFIQIRFPLIPPSPNWCCPRGLGGGGGAAMGPWGRSPSCSGAGAGGRQQGMVVRGGAVFWREGGEGSTVKLVWGILGGYGQHGGAEGCRAGGGWQPCWGGDTAGWAGDGGRGAGAGCSPSTLTGAAAPTDHSFPSPAPWGDGGGGGGGAAVP